MPSSDTLQAQKAATAAEVAAATAKLYSQAQETYAEDAASSATEASAYAQSASDSASLAQQYYSLSLDSVLWFVGSYDTAPTERNNGTALEVGDMYKNTADNEVYSFNSDGTWSSMNSDATLIQELYAAGEGLLEQGKSVYSNTVSVYESTQELYQQSTEQYDISVELYDVVKSIFSPEGFGEIGKVLDINELRSISPSESGSSVILERAVDGGPLLNAIVTYDADDTKSDDNGVYIFVSADGSRWKADISNGLDPRLAGYLEGSQDMAASINKCAQLIAANYVAGTPVSSTINTIKVPFPEDGSSVYYIAEAIKLPSMATLKMEGNIIFDLTSASQVSGLRICNSDFPGLVSSVTGVTDTKYNGHMMTMEFPSDPVIGGRLKFRKTYDTTDTSSIGVLLGNVASGFVDVRSITVKNVNVTGFYIGCAFGTYGTYICGFDNCYSYGNQHALSFTATDRNNSGEKFFFNNGLLSDSYATGIYMNCNGIELHCDNISLDYTTTDGILYGPAANSDIYITHSHIEGVQGLIVNVPSSTSAPKYGRRVDFGFCNFDLSSGQKGSQGWNKNWFYSAGENCVVNIHKSCRVWYATNSQPKSAYPSLCYYDATNNVQLSWDVTEEELESWSTSLLGIIKPGGYNRKVISTNIYTGTSGDEYTGFGQSHDSYGWYVYNGTWTYGDAGDDGLQPIELTSTSSSTIYYIVCAIPVTMMPGDYARAFGSIKIDSSVEGSVNIGCTIDIHSLITAGSSGVSDNVVSSVSSSLTNILTSANSNGLIGEYQGFSTVAAQAPTNVYSSRSPMFSYVGIRISGFTGKISLKIPTVTTHSLLLD